MQRHFATILAAANVGVDINTVADRRHRPPQNLKQLAQAIRDSVICSLPEEEYESFEAEEEWYMDSHSYDPKIEMRETLEMCGVKNSKLYDEVP